MRRINIHWVAIIGLILCIFLDGTLSQQFASRLFTSSAKMVPELTTLWLLAAAFFEDQIHVPTYWLALGAGLIYDSFYSGYWGIYLLAFPVVVWLARTLRQYLPVNLFATLLVGFLAFAVPPLFNWLGLLIAGATDASVADFMVLSLAPTLALNEILLIIFHLPLRRLYLNRY